MVLVIGCLASIALLIACASEAHAAIIDPTIDPFSITVSPGEATPLDTISLKAIRLCAFPNTGFAVVPSVTVNGNQILLEILSFRFAPQLDLGVFPAAQDLETTVAIGPLAPGTYDVTATWLPDGVERESTSLSFTVVPESSSWLSLSLGIAGIVMIRRKLASRA